MNVLRYMYDQIPSTEKRKVSFSSLLLKLSLCSLQVLPPIFLTLQHTHEHPTSPRPDLNYGLCPTASLLVFQSAIQFESKSYFMVISLKAIFNNNKATVYGLLNLIC